MIVDADLERIDREVAIETPNSESICVDPIRMVSAEIEVQIFSLHAPRRAPHIFDTAADGPSIEPAVVANRPGQDTITAAVNCEIGVKEGPTTFNVEQRGTGRIAETARYISIKVAIVLDVQKSPASVATKPSLFQLLVKPRRQNRLRRRTQMRRSGSYSQ